MTEPRTPADTTPTRPHRMGQGKSADALSGWFYPPGRDPAAEQPRPRHDVLAWRGPRHPDDGDSIGWDFVWLDDSGTWHSATYCGEAIDPPVAWWPLPPQPEASAHG